MCNNESFMNTNGNNWQQESPPAWTQEAYRPPCSKYSLCCPNWVPPPRPGYPPQPGYPPGQGTPLPRPGYPPPAGPGREPPPRLDLAGYPPRLPHGILGNVAKHYGIWVPPPVDRQMDGRTDACQNITFPRTPYAGGKYCTNELEMHLNLMLHYDGNFLKMRI